MLLVDVSIVAAEVGDMDEASPCSAAKAIGVLAAGRMRYDGGVGSQINIPPVITPRAP